MIHLRELDRVVLKVADLESMLSIYCGLLGCTVGRRHSTNASKASIAGSHERPLAGTRLLWRWCSESARR
jgi:catechol-2,3-dioxygenase